MTKNFQLTQEERDFFSLVMNAALANPFSNDRIKADLKISGVFADTPKDVILETAVQAVRNRLEQFKKEGKADLNRYKEPDKTIIRAAFMFDFFHAWADEFDRMIQDQTRESAQTKTGSQPVRFADRALAELEEKGFTKQEALHYFSLCFQIRRAYFFIDKNLVGQSQSMRRLREALWNNVFTSDLLFYTQHMWDKMEDFSTLIIGETGSGKGTAAIAIGRSGFIPFDEKTMCFSQNFTRSFVSLNISQFPENLIESELFGHKKGSFTGAVEDHKGIFSKCSPYGSIFLDEIGEVAEPIQIKLLKVLEDRQFSPVGSRETLRFKGRIITATNRSMAQLHNPDVLRKDFYYRLCSDIIVVPPLRQRIKENPFELDYLLKNRILKIIGSASPGTVAMVRNILKEKLGPGYSWPGNVRELEQYVRRILLNRNACMPDQAGNICSAGSPESSGTRLAAPISKGEITAQDLLNAYCYELFEKYNTIGEVARRTGLDRRTVKKYCDNWTKK